MFEQIITDVPLAEFDMGGVLYHANYFRLYERAREAMLRERGIPYADLVNEGYHLAVVESHQVFKAPIRYGDALRIKTWISELRQSVVTFQYEITLVSAPERILHTGWTTQAFVGVTGKGFRPSRFVGKLLTVLREHSIDP